MSKKVAFGTKPTPKKDMSVDADQWVEHRTDEPNKRLTLDVPASLHARIKAQCAMRGVKMSEEIRALLEEHFSESPLST